MPLCRGWHPPCMLPGLKQASRKEAGLGEQGDGKATNTAQGVHGSFQKKGT